MRIYTKTGDAGETSLFDNTRVAKSDARVDAYGEVDELNASLGAVCSSGVDADLATEIEKIQKELFAIGARLADPRSRIAERVTKAAVADADVTRLERLIDMLETEVRCAVSSFPAAPRPARCCTRLGPSAVAWSAVSSLSGRTPSRRSSSCISTGCPICSS